MPKQTESSTMVGRRAELAALLGAFDQSAAGTSSVLVIRGEAGIGKTRLLNEFLVAAHQRPRGDGPELVVATGQCVDLGPIGAPFTPIRRLLRDIYLAVGDEAFRSAAGSATVVNTLSVLVPELTVDSEPLSPDGGYIAEAIERIIENLSTTRQLLLVIEDLHWADAATIALLKTLAVTMRGRHVLLVWSYRTNDVGRGHPLRAALAELDRGRTATTVEVSRLSAEEIAEQARNITGSAPQLAELEALIARSEGVPFFVEELITLIGQPLPPTLRDIVLARYERLTPRARDLVSLVAVGGMHVEHELLETVSDADPAALREGLREAIAESILIATHDGYSFRHALIQEAVHDELLPSERVSRHAVYALALQAQLDAGNDAEASAAAEHWLACRDLPRAFDATVTARASSIARNAPAAATRLGERLLELWAQVPDADARARTTRAHLSLALAKDFYDLGETERALRTAQAGLAFAGDDVTLRADLHREIGTRFRSVGRLAESVTEFERASTVLGTPEGPEQQALLAKIKAMWAVAESVEPHESAFDDAIALAELSGDEDALAQTLYLRSWYLSDAGHLDDAIAGLNRALQLRSTPSTRFTVMNNMVDLLGQSGAYRQAIEVGVSAAAEAAELGRDRGLGAYIMSNVAELELAIGDLINGLPRAERSAALLRGNVYFESFALRIQALAQLWNDEPALSGALVEQGSPLRTLIDDDAEERAGWALVDADTALRDFHESGDARPLDEVAKRLVAVLESERIGPNARIVPTSARVSVHSPHHGGILRSTVARVAHDLPHSPLRDATLAIATAECSDGVDEWREATRLAAEGLVPVRYLHLARYRLATAFVAAGRRDEAVEPIESVLAEAPGHGCELIARWTRELAVRAGIVAEGAPDARGASPTTVIGSLTPRELQVLELVAAGLTNPQIGKRLFISPKTASVHVSAILAKVGAANRAEAAAAYVAGLPVATNNGS